MSFADRASSSAIVFLVCRLRVVIERQDIWRVLIVSSPRLAARIHMTYVQFLDHDCSDMLRPDHFCFGQPSMTMWLSSRASIASLMPDHHAQDLPCCFSSCLALLLPLAASNMFSKPPCLYLPCTNTINKGRIFRSHGRQVGPRFTAEVYPAR